MKEELEEMKEILDNLDQSIITISKDKVGYCNKLGLKVYNDLSSGEN